MIETLILGRVRLVFSAVVLLTLLGATAWFSMPRQEDPNIRDYWGNLTVVLPGADAATVERLLLNPLEEELLEVDDIHFIEGTAQDQLALVHIELSSEVADIDEAWDTVREAIRRAEKEFPHSAQPAELDDQINDQESIVLALTGLPLLALTDRAEALKKDLLSLSLVKRVVLIAEAEESVTIILKEGVMERYQLNLDRLGAFLRQQNTITPGGTLNREGQTLVLRPRTEFTSVEELRQLEIPLQGQAHLPLSALAEVITMPLLPEKAVMHWQGQRAVGLGVIPKAGINLEQFGRDVCIAIEAQRKATPDLAIDFVTFQPDRVSSRLQELSRSLAMGIAVVALVVIFAMGMRLGLIVAAIVPLVAVTSLAIYAGMGGQLHQISIAAFVIALGMLVDNAIVMAENIQWRLDEGDQIKDAVLRSLRELAFPLGTATGTTMAAFVPMLMSKGITAEFTGALPVIIMLTLTVSYGYALLVTPAVSRFFLRRRQRGDSKGSLNHLSAWITQHPFWVLGATGLIVVFTLSLSQHLEQNFFPPSDRNQVLLELKHREGTHLSRTLASVRTLEDWLLQQEETTKVASFAGRSAPHFYYNITSIPWRPHLAQILVETQNESQLTAFIAKVETFSASSLVGVELIPRRLEQGPPVNAPIEVRLSGDDLSALFQGAETVVDLLAALPGATSVRHSMGLGSPQVQLHFDQDRLNRFGVNRDEVARILLTMSEGLPLGNDWSDEESRPLLLREGPGQEHQLEEILGRQLITMEGKTVPLSQLARVDLDWQPGQFTHRNGRRMVSVSAQLKDGFSFGAVQKALNERLMGISLPEGITWSYGGQAEGSSEANSSLMAALPWGLFLLFALLMAEFNSFRRVMLVLMTVPLAAAGVVPGLLLSGHPFGFMAMLGTIALIGVVVNNAIVLIDFADREQAKGTSIQEAFSLAIDRRLRPILLTTATTVAGLLPLAFSGSSLWPPLAWAMISGLFASTFLTLGAVPALGVLILRPMFSKIKKSSLFSILWVGWLLPALWMIPVQWGRAADQIPPLGLHEAIEASLNHARVRSLQSQQAAVVEEGVLEWRKQRLPALASTASVSWQDQGVILETPLGPFTLGDQDQWHFTTALSQTIYDPVYTYGTRPIREAKIRGADTEVTLAALIQAEGVIRLYFSLLDTQAKEAILKEQQERLAAHHQTLMKRVEAGRSLKVEADDLQWQRQRLALDRQQLEMEKALLWDQLCAQTESPHWRDRLLLLPELRMDLQEQSARRDALAQHPQLQWLSAQRQVVEGSLSASKHSLLPTVEANALYLDSQGDPFTGEDRFSVNLTAKVTWLSKGTRAPERRMLNHQLEALSRQTQSALQALEVHFDSILRAWAQAHHRRNLTREQELLAKNILEVETRRFEAGRITTSQLMDAETNLRSAQEEGILSEHEIRRQSWLSDIALGHVPFIQ